MRDAWPEVARGVDRVTGGTSERETDCHHDHADEHGSETFREVRPRHEVTGRDHSEKSEHEGESADNLRQKIGERLSDRGRGGEHCELAHRIRRRLPMREICEPHDDAAQESARDLGSDVHGDFGPIKSSNGGKRDRDCRIQVRAADTVDAVDGDRDAERPAGGDDDPAGVVPFRALQHDVGDDAIAEHDQDGGAEKLGENGGHVDWVKGYGVSSSSGAAARRSPARAEPA